MNRKEALAQVRKILTGSNIEDAALEGEILLRHTLGLGRAQLFADLESEVSHTDYKALMSLADRRIKGEPSAYITGRKEFYGLEFKVNRRVLIPRPETEMLVEKGIALCRGNKYSKVADIGTGCGAIAVSLAVNLPAVKVYAADISPEALEVARQNCAKHDVKDRITLLQGDLLEPLPEPVDLIIANLPYVRDSDMPPSSFEPQVALNGGKKGLDKIDELCQRAGDKFDSKACLLLEIGQGQAADVKTILHKYFASGLIEVQKDFAGIERIVCLRLT